MNDDEHPQSFESVDLLSLLGFGSLHFYQF